MVEQKGKEQLEKLMNRDSMSMDMERSGMELKSGYRWRTRLYHEDIHETANRGYCHIKKEKGRIVKKYKLEGTE